MGLGSKTRPLNELGLGKWLKPSLIPLMRVVVPVCMKSAEPVRHHKCSRNTYLNIYHEAFFIAIKSPAQRRGQKTHSRRTRSVQPRASLHKRDTTNSRRRRLESANKKFDLKKHNLKERTAEFQEMLKNVVKVYQQSSKK